MPIKKTVYDKGDPKAEPPVPARTHEMWGLDAAEAVANGKGRYSLTKPPGFGAAPPPSRGRAKPAAEPAPVADQTEPNE